MKRLAGAGWMLLICHPLACGRNAVSPTSDASPADVGDSAACEQGDASDLVDPSAALTDPQTPGTCACAGNSLANVLGEIASANPQLADITALAGAAFMDSERLIFAFSSPGFFRIIYKRGSGDCPAGCISNEYWYFETDGACIPRQVGHYSAQLAPNGTCFLVEGQPLWGFPAPRSSCPDGGSIDASVD